MSIAPLTLPEDLESLRAVALSQHHELDACAEQIAQRDQEVRQLAEYVRLLKHQHFGRTSEKAAVLAQLGLFTEAELAVDAEAKAEAPAIEIAAHTHTPRGRRPLPAWIPRLEVLHDLAESEKTCPHDGTRLTRIGEDTCEQLELLETFKKHYPRDYPLPLLLARTGLRIGEAIALKWDDIDFNSRFLTIRRNFSRGKIETPKSGKSRRVDMSLQLTESLQDLRHQRRVETLKKGWREVPEWVFLTAEGTPMDSCNWRNRVFNKALKKAELRKIRIHDLRHTYASLLIQDRQSLAYVRDQLGHHSIKVTVDIYGHLAPEGNKEAVDRLDDPRPEETIRNPGATKTAEGADHVGQPLDFTGGSDETPFIEAGITAGG